MNLAKWFALVLALLVGACQPVDEFEDIETVNSSNSHFDNFYYLVEPKYEGQLVAYDDHLDIAVFEDSYKRFYVRKDQLVTTTPLDQPLGRVVLDHDLNHLLLVDGRCYMLGEDQLEETELKNTQEHRSQVLKKVHHYSNNHLTYYYRTGSALLPYKFEKDPHPDQLLAAFDSSYKIMLLVKDKQLGPFDAVSLSMDQDLEETLPYITVIKDNQMGVVDYNGQWVVQAKYALMESHPLRYCWVGQTSYRCLDQLPGLSLDRPFYWFHQSNHTYIAASKDKTIGFINLKTGQELGFEFEEAGIIGEDNQVWVRLFGKWGQIQLP